jgi:transcriptional antiterminator RfaH
MPILPVEPCQFPDELLHEPSIDGPPRQWYAVYTRARQEKALARELWRWQIPFYLPLVPRNLLIRGRPVQSHVPLFVGYLFLFGTNDERVRALSTNRISQVLTIPDPQQLKHDLRQVQRLIEADAPLTVESRLAPGQRVRIRSGSLLGLEGVVESRRGTCRLVVAVNFLQQGVSIEVDDFLVEPLS